MLKALQKRKPVPLIDGPPITFTPQERERFWVEGKFDEELFKVKLAEKALIIVLRHSEGAYLESPAYYKLRDSSVTKAPRRFWGRLPLGYHIIRLHFGYGESERYVALRYVRSSEDNFVGRIYNHPPRRNRAK